VSDTLEIDSKDIVRLRATTDWNDLDCDTLAQFRLVDSLPAGFIPNWTIISGDSATISNPNGNRMILTGRAGKSYTVRLSILPNVCLESSANFVVSLRKRIKKPVAPNVTLCGKGNLIFRAPDLTDTVIWYSDRIGFKKVSEPSVNDSVIVNKQTIGDTILYVSNYENGCRSFPIPVKGTIYDPVQATLPFADTTILLGTNIQLSANGGTTFAWSPGAGLSDSTIANPIANPIKNTLYTVTSTDANGCITTTQVQVNISTQFNYPNVIYINSDIVNNTFWHVLGEESFKQSTITVYNRFGTKVYAADARAPRWNAETVSGGLYYITLTGKLLNDETVNYKGWIQVIK
jgi:hypothetical protein